MNIPSVIKIGGHLVKVNKEKDRSRMHGTNNAGSAQVWSNQIWIDTDADQQQQETTLIHEILEVIVSLTDIKMEHKDLCVIETMLYQVLVDNNLLK